MKLSQNSNFQQVFFLVPIQLCYEAYAINKSNSESNYLGFEHPNYVMT